MNHTHHFGYLAFLFAFSISAQEFPDAGRLAELSRQAPGGRQNVEFTREISWQGEAGLPGAVNTVALFQFSNGKFRIDFKNNLSPELFVMDGEYLWSYLSIAREYTRIRLPPPLSMLAF